jgi:hypothetical protein
MFGDAQIAADLACTLALGQFDFCLPQQAEIIELRGSVARMDRVAMRPTPPNECMKTPLSYIETDKGRVPKAYFLEEL